MEEFHKATLKRIETILKERGEVNPRFFSWEPIVLRNQSLDWSDLASTDFSYAILQKMDLTGAILKNANFNEAMLLEVNLESANLENADLTAAKFEGVSFIGANLRNAELSFAYFYRKVSLEKAILKNTNCQFTYFGEINLTDANLEDACLYGTNLKNVELKGANLKNAEYDLMTVLSINLGKLSDELTLEFMRWDATICGEEKMNVWASGGECPFEDSNIQRIFNFKENPQLWKPGKPTMTLMELWRAVAKELNIQI